MDFPADFPTELTLLFNNPFLVYRQTPGEKAGLDTTQQKLEN
jgi:hypothetical protein